jgi:hypothetical protein
MRTSLEIPDPLFKEAKRLALERNTTLKALVASGLEKILSEASQPTAASRPDSARLPKVRPAGEGTYTLSNADVDRLLAEEEAAHYGRPR